MQIADNITEKVINGTYPEGEKIPSVREMAADLGVNPNTILRTFSELQHADIIGNKRGIGFFVAPNAQERILEQKRREFFEKELPKFKKQAELLGINAKELKKHLDELNNEDNHEKK